MSVIRIVKRKHYTSIANSVIEDTRLSLKARGLLCYLLSKPDDWTINFAQLCRISSKDGATSVRSALGELVKYGYATFEQKREHGLFAEGGWLIYESPQIGFPHADFPHVDSPHMENGHAYQRLNILKTESEAKTEEKKDNSLTSFENMEGAGKKTIPAPPCANASQSEAMPMGVKKVPISEDDWPGLRQILTDFNLPMTQLDDNNWWNSLSYTCNSPDNAWLTAQFARMEAWLTENPRKRPTTRWKTFVRGWLERAYEYDRRMGYATQK